jgi:hypothetical protein
LRVPSAQPATAEVGTVSREVAATGVERSRGRGGWRSVMGKEGLAARGARPGGARGEGAAARGRVGSAPCGGRCSVGRAAWRPGRRPAGARRRHGERWGLRRGGSPRREGTGTHGGAPSGERSTRRRASVGCWQRGQRVRSRPVERWSSAIQFDAGAATNAERAAARRASSRCASGSVVGTCCGANNPLWRIFTKPAGSTCSRGGGGTPADAP